MLVGAACAVSALAHASEPPGDSDASRLERHVRIAWSERRICEQVASSICK
jgi:hypothetical protein